MVEEGGGKREHQKRRTFEDELGGGARGVGGVGGDPDAAQFLAVSLLGVLSVGRLVAGGTPVLSHEGRDLRFVDILVARDQQIEI